MRITNNNDLSRIYDTNPNALAQIFEKAGYNSEEIEKFFNNESKETIILRVQKIIEALKETMYHIPEKYETSEIDVKTISPKYRKIALAHQEDRSRMYDEMDYSIDKKLGETLQALYDYESDKYYIGIHRTSANKESIMQEGIEYTPAQDFTDHVQITENLPLMLREIKHCNNYKNSDGCVIVKIPKKDVDIRYASSDSKPVYYINPDNNKKSLMPEYITGYVKVENGKLISYVPNTYNHDNLYNANTIFQLDESIVSLFNEDNKSLK